MNYCKFQTCPSKNISENTYKLGESNKASIYTYIKLRFKILPGMVNKQMQKVAAINVSGRYASVLITVLTFDLNAYCIPLSQHYHFVHIVVKRISTSHDECPSRSFSN